ncbi:MAG TPA: thioredoxin [Rhodocyclaceae bacterium]|nr:thioredoxin [Rhodocyclaceae bacterium]
MATVELTTENFNEVVARNSMLIVDFWASWCGPCRSFAPTFEAAAEKHTDIVFGKVNTEEQQQLAGAFNIRSIPTLMVFRDQIIVYADAGALPPAGLQQLIDGVRGLDMDKVRAEIAAEQQEPG